MFSAVSVALGHRRIRSATVVVIALLAGSLAACGTTISTGGGSTEPAPLPVEDPSAPMPAPGTCTIRHEAGGPLPDPHCTPGAINPAVTQATIGTTICRSGWTATVRPPSSVTGRMKKQSDLSYGLPTSTTGEYDHLISLELGGAPDDPRNLWVEPGSIPNPKDTIENRLADAVCAGLIPLVTAQQAIARDWVSALEDTGLATTGGKLCLRAEPTHCANGRHNGTE